eukprot:SAG22_NODE_199_length_15450_cov_11.690704_3_plen_475_part_00
MSALIDNSFNKSSWGESLQAYKASKVNLGYDQQPPHHETHFAHSRNERDNKVDPVLQRFRDPAKESNLRQWEDTHNVKGLNKSFDLQLTRECQFDVVSHKSRKEGLSGVNTGDLEPRQRPNLSLQSGVHYNILSNHSHEDHAMPSRERPKRAYTPQKTYKRFGIEPKWAKKDWDMISNKFYYGHDQYEAQQRSVALDTAAERFFARNNKNPVTGKYFDGEKERAVTDLEEEAKLTHGAHQMDIYPPRIKYGPGMAFDIATHTVKDGELFEFLKEKDEEKRRGAYCAMAKRELEHEYKTERDTDAAMKDGRRYLRVNAKRFEEPLRKGYDIVTNEGLQGRNSKTVFPHRLPEKPHFWHTLDLGNETTNSQRMRSTAPIATNGGGGGSSAAVDRAPAAPISIGRRASNASSAARSQASRAPSLTLPKPAEVPSLSAPGQLKNTVLGASSAPPAVRKDSIKQGNSIRSGGFQNLEGY